MHQNSTPAEEARLSSEISNPIRLLGVNLTFIYLFVRITNLQDALFSLFRVNTHLVWIFGVPAILCFLMSGSLSRAVKPVAARYWIGFAVLLIMSVPFSDWIAESLQLVWAFLHTDLIVLFLIGGMVLTWKECWRLLQVLAAAAVLVVGIAFVFPTVVDPNGRLILSISTTMSNANDYAALLNLLIPFLALVVVTPKRSMILRIGALLIFVYGVYVILSFGSRGALVALVITAMVLLTKLSFTQRIVAISMLGVISILAFAALPSSTRSRLTTLFSADSNEATTEAVYSTSSRMYLFRKSLEFTLEHPLFGVGVGQFANHEGLAARESGDKGSWHTAHNTYTEVSSEAGIPAALFYMLAMASTFWAVLRTYRMSLAQPQTAHNARISVALFTVFISMVAFCSSIMFLSLAYRLYLPALTGIIIAMQRAAKYEWAHPPRQV